MKIIMTKITHTKRDFKDKIITKENSNVQINPKANYSLFKLLSPPLLYIKTIVNV